ncbi:hypothetical protein CABS02_14414 [Colletotrichum abscissum]|uniref:Uncharacterized protein n=1 Tax=Colletotrichum abscissum TaxID=1671311 RepID=A0A9P9X1A6_9PEZI|nr:hypothetical protein CABS02_14414 [Colletotrichum abscissum]
MEPDGIGPSYQHHAEQFAHSKASASYPRAAVDCASRHDGLGCVSHRANLRSAGAQMCMHDHSAGWAPPTSRSTRSPFPRLESLTHPGSLPSGTSTTELGPYASVLPGSAVRAGPHGVLQGAPNCG